jgi:uncharacterized membrane protein
VTKTIKNLSTKLQIGLICTHLSYATLLGVLTVWAFTRAPGFSPVLWVIVCVPLLLFWPGMRKKKHRTYSWLCFVLLLYFIKAVEGSLSSAASWIDFSVVTLTVVLFISAMLTSRWLQHARVQDAETETAQIEKETP